LHTARSAVMLWFCLKTYQSTFAPSCFCSLMQASSHRLLPPSPCALHPCGVQVPSVPMAPFIWCPMLPAPHWVARVGFPSALALLWQSHVAAASSSCQRTAFNQRASMARCIDTRLLHKHCKAVQNTVRSAHISFGSSHGPHDCKQP
jgi:hypothetical protein